MSTHFCFTSGDPWIPPTKKQKRRGLMLTLPLTFPCHDVSCQWRKPDDHWEKMARRTMYIHYSDVIMDMIAFQITRLMIVYSTDYSGAHKKHQSSASLAFMRGIHRWPVNSPHKWPVTSTMFPFDDAIMFHVGVRYNDELMQEIRNSIANALELRLSCINPSIWCMIMC